MKHVPVAIVCMKSDKHDTSIETIVDKLQLGEYLSDNVKVFSHSNYKNKEETLAIIFDWIQSKV